MGLLDFEVNVVLARLEADFSDQPPSIPAVPSRRVSLKCPSATKYPRSAQPLQCPTAKYPCSAQLQSIPAVSKHQISPQGKSIPAVPNRRVSLECPTAEYQFFLQRMCSAARKTVEGGQGNATLIVQSRL